MNNIKGSIWVKALVHFILFLLGLTLLLGLYHIYTYLDSYSTSTATFIETSDFQNKYLKYVERVAVYIDYREKGYTGSVGNDSSLNISALFEKEEATPDSSEDTSNQKDFDYYNAIVNNTNSNFLYLVKNLKTGTIYCSPALEKDITASMKRKGSSKAVTAYLKKIQQNTAYLIINTETKRYVTNVNRNYKYLNEENINWVIDYINGNISTNPVTAENENSEYLICTSIVEGFPNINDEFGIMNTHFNELNNNYKEFLYPVPIAFLFLLLFFVLAITMAGHKKGVDGITLNVFDRQYTEVGLVLVVIGILFLYYIGMAFSRILYFNIHVKIFFIITFAYTLIYPFCMLGLMSLVRRCKANVIFQNSLFYMGSRKLWSFIKNFFAQRNLTYRVALLLSIFIAIQVISFYILCRPAYQHMNAINGIYMVDKADISDFMNKINLINKDNIKNKDNLVIFVIIVILDYLFLGYVLLKVAIDYNILRNETKKLTEGALNHKIPISDMCAPARTLGEYINNIGDGFSAAVDEKVKSERLKTELITNVSHDIKTPLTSIINYVDLLKKQNLQNETALEYLEILSAKSWRLKTLIEDLVEASKASSGTIPMNLECLNLVELVRQSLGEFEDRFLDHNLETILNIDEEPIYIIADGRSTYRIIENIFSNVNKYALSGTRIYVDITSEIETVTVSVKNISSSKLNMNSDELLERFARGDMSRNTEGSGLGLSIAKSLANLQNATFDIILDGDLFKVILRFQRLKQPPLLDVKEEITDASDIDNIEL